jgi:hypothetical protein
MTPPLQNAKAALQGGSADLSTTLHSSQEVGASASRKRPHLGYWCTAEEAFRVIERSFEEMWAQRAAKSAYTALCRKANLRGAATFEDTIGNLAKDMSYGYREAQRAVRLLENIGLVAVTRRKIPGTKANSPSIYAVKTWQHYATTSLHKEPTLKHRAGRLEQDGLRVMYPQLPQELPEEQSPNISLSAPPRPPTGGKREKENWMSVVQRLASEHAVPPEAVEKARARHRTSLSNLKSGAYQTPENFERALPNLLSAAKTKSTNSVDPTNKARERAVQLRNAYWARWQREAEVSTQSSWEHATSAEQQAFRASKWGDYFRGQAEGFGGQITVDDFGAIGATPNI